MPNIPILSVEESLERMAGDRELLGKLFQLFMTDAPKKLEQISAALSQIDYYQTERTAHSLKGASATVGAVRLCQAAAEVEQAARQKDGQSLTLLVQDLNQVCAQTLEAMREYCAVN